MGIRCSNYIDDFIFFAASMKEALRVRALVLKDLTAAGWYISVDKSMLRPGTMVKYLGLILCSLPVPHVRVPFEKVVWVKQAFVGVLRRAAQGDRVFTVGRTLASALGFLQSLRLAVSLVPVFTRELYACMAQLPRVDLGWFDLDQRLQLSEGAMAECKLWAGCIDRWNGFLLTPVHVSRVVYTDGCSTGFGGLVHRVLGRQVDPALLAVKGQWEYQMSVDSVMTELAGFWRVLVGAGEELVEQTVLHRTDSISTYAVLAKGGSARSARLTALVRRIMVYCLLHNITLASQYVGAGVIIKSGANLLSRKEDVSDCMLNPVLFSKLWHMWGPFAADMFASRASVQNIPGTDRPLPYWSLWADGTAKGVDALTADWQAEAATGVLYAFPPVPLVGHVLQLVIQAKVSAVVVFPDWPAQWWWPLVLEHARGPIVDFERIHVEQVEGSTFVQGRKGLRSHPFGSSFAEWAKVH